jgi:hypothetical protein
MKTFIFYEEGKQNEPEFEIEVEDNASFEDVFDKAYEEYGPQVSDLYYTEKLPPF